LIDLAEPLFVYHSTIHMESHTHPSLAPGSRLGPYEIQVKIGEGGMGEVWKARDTRLNRSVALKISKAGFSDRFEREARAVAALTHEHICRLYDIGPNYLVMEMVEGETLAVRLSRERLSIAETLRFGAQIADALAEAHAKGITHRDLKPANVMVTKSGIKVLDFGLAKVEAPPGETLTATSVVMGTPAYMAPEQLAGQPADARTDIYALGLVLFEMATGKRLSHTPPTFEGIPEKLAHVMDQCLEKDPGERWQSASDLSKELAWCAKNDAAPIVATQQPSLRRWA
jgi:serine/threonine protein kinase